MAPSSSRGRRSRGRPPRGDACGQPCIHSPQSSCRRGASSSREHRRSLAIRSSADGALQALRRSTGLRALCRSAATRADRSADVLRNLTRGRYPSSVWDAIYSFNACRALASPVTAHPGAHRGLAQALAAQSAHLPASWATRELSGAHSDWTSLYPTRRHLFSSLKLVSTSSISWGSVGQSPMSSGSFFPADFTQSLLPIPSPIRCNKLPFLE